jgi:hypothetical protein
MRKTIKQFAGPLSSISDRPVHFCVWWSVVICLGLAGFWLPILLAKTGGGDARAVFQTLVYAGTLASFSVVLLADGIASILIVVGAGSNIKAAGMRALVGCAALVLAVIQVGVLVFAHSGEGTQHTSVSAQLLFTGLTVVVATYLYCFRFPSWEHDVAEVKEKEDKEVNKLSQSAEEQHTDEGGTTL